MDALETLVQKFVQPVESLSIHSVFQRFHGMQEAR